jgi:hypothetical protein
MNIDRIHKTLVSGKPVVLLVLAVFIFIRLNGNRDNLEIVYATVIQTGIAILLTQVNRISTITRADTVLPATLYLLFTGFDQTPYNSLNSSLTSLCIALSVLFIFLSWQNPRAEVQSLNISLTLTLGSLLWTPMLFFYPLFWYGFYRLKGWNRRIIPAAIIGYLALYTFIFAWNVHTGNPTATFSYLPRVAELFTFCKPELTIEEWGIFALAAVMFLNAGINLYITGVSENIRTVFSLQTLYIPSIVITTFYLLQTQYKQHWTLILYIPLSIIITWYFTNTESRFRKYTLFLLTTALFTVRILQNFTPDLIPALKTATLHLFGTQ